MSCSKLLVNYYVYMQSANGDRQYAKLSSRVHSVYLQTTNVYEQSVNVHNLINNTCLLNEQNEKTVLKWYQFIVYKHPTKQCFR